jgi:serine/threonine protein phosphatase PrpC
MAIADLDLPNTAKLEQPLLSIRSYGLTDQGRVRRTNEDHFVIADLARVLRLHGTSLRQPPLQCGDAAAYLFIVADGIGGHQGGETASALAVQTIEAFALDALRCFGQLSTPDEEAAVLGELQAAVRQADRRLIEESSRRPEVRGMGTTVTMAYCLGSELFVAHVGDCRCYLLRQDQLQPLTRDHTLAEELVRRGALRPEEAARHQYRHVVTNAVGGREPGIDVEVHKVGLQAGDLLLLCSDGLTEMLPKDRVTAVLQAEDDPKAACERLVTEANERGGRDNITVVVARFDPPARVHQDSNPDR